MPDKLDETLWDRLSRAWRQHRLPPHLAEDAGLPVAQPHRILNPLVAAFLH
jgi:hypothetical protein